MAKKECIIIGIISAILTAVFVLLVNFLLYVVTVAFCFGFFT